MKFSKQYSKLKKPIFTTIRKNTGFYIRNQVVNIETPTEKFKAKIEWIEKITKEELTNRFSKSDADCSKEELIKMLEKWYGKKYNDFIILTLKRIVKGE